MKDQIVSNSQPAISVKNLDIIFDEGTENETRVLENFSYDFQKNKIYFIIGNSGTGKTTLATHFNGLLKSKYGDIVVGDITINGKKRKIKNFKKLRKTCGMVFQFPEYQLFKDTIEKDIIFGPVNLGDKKEIAKEKAKKYLNMLGLPDEFLQRSPFDLSGGQKRRVAIAGILAIEPDILVFDEPTAGLDPAGEKEMMEIISNLRKENKTIIVISHVMDQVLALADEVLVLDNKKMVDNGDPYKIFTNKSLINSSSLDTPKIISIINALVKKDHKFNVLYETKPKNILELSMHIKRIVGVKHE